VRRLAKGPRARISFRNIAVLFLRPALRRYVGEHVGERPAIGISGRQPVSCVSSVASPRISAGSFPRTSALSISMRTALRKGAQLLYQPRILKASPAAMLTPAAPVSGRR